jgi:adenylate cyclase
MLSSFQIRVCEQAEEAYRSPEFEGSLELGRQKPGEPGLFSVIPLENNRKRLIIARSDEATVSRRHVLIEPMAAGRVRLTNLREMNVRLPGNAEMGPGTSFEFSLPCEFPLAKRLIRIEPVDADDMALYSLAEPARLPGQDSANLIAVPNFNLVSDGTISAQAVIRWLYDALDVLQSAIHSADFYQKAAQAAIGMVGLDACRVLLRQRDNWEVQAAAAAGLHDDESAWRPSRRVLSRIQEERRTFWQVPGQSGGGETVGASLVGVRALVAAPIMDPRGQVIGALYGERRKGRGATAVPQVSEIDAKIMELLAWSIATGLARMEMEKVAVEAQVRFEQFFTPELSRQLAGRPELLDGRQEEVTCLICDIRGSSRITERLGPSRTIDWIRDVMSHVSDCVMDHGGVIVDFTGDGALAMWGAPEKQADHAERACRAALAMLATLPKLDERWSTETNERMAFGIGISSGPAQVGNIGSRRKFKYGPLGNTVNLASRVEGATKYLKSNVLITGSTKALLGQAWHTRRLARVRTMHIAEPVDLYELTGDSSQAWESLRESYEGALDAFEKKDLRAAARILGALQIDYPNDGPSLVLLARTVQYLADDGAAFEPVYTLPGK